MSMSSATITGITLLAALAAMALLAPWLVPPGSPIHPASIDLSACNCPVGTPGHILGTDHLGRDIFGQAVWGARASLAVGLMAAAVAVSVGSLWGSFSALSGGLVDMIMMRIVDGLLSIPSIVLLLALQALVSTPALAGVLPAPVLEALAVTNYSFGLLPLVTVVLVVSATTWLEAARLAHAQVLAVKQQEYVLAARALGVGASGMLMRHLLPNARVVIVVEAALLVSDAVLMESGLSFLGLGLGPGIPSWGGMLASAQTALIQGNWWAAVVPGLFITATVLAVNLIGEGSLARTPRRKDSVKDVSAMSF
ncbi:MAG TPA: ABC transporter permease [Candidatus Obscuribacterales bacterium]